MIRPRRESHGKFVQRITEDARFDAGQTSESSSQSMADESFLLLDQRRRSLPVLTLLLPLKPSLMFKSRSPLPPSSPEEKRGGSSSSSSSSRANERATPVAVSAGETSADRSSGPSSIHAIHKRPSFASDGYASDGLQGRIQEQQHGPRRTNVSNQHQRFPQQRRQSVQASSRVTELPRQGLGTPLQHAGLLHLKLNTSSLSVSSLPPPILVQPSFALHPTAVPPVLPARHPERISSKGERERPSTASGALGGSSGRDMTQQDASTTFARSRNAASKSKNLPTLEERTSRFSTADRTILNELIQSLAARNSQFTTKNGKKHHPYARQVVPYPRSYDRAVLDHDTWELLAIKAFSKTVTYHTLFNPPAKVLDLGCGTGSWILHAAQTWKKAHFVGLDIVPLYPDLQRTGQTDLAKRVTWVQHNFLETLPFPNEEFDFVILRRIARGVPENKWDELFEELLRVMKPGAAIEIAEEDLYLPGSVTSLSLSGNESSTSLSTSTGTNIRTPRQSHELSSTENIESRPRITTGSAVELSSTVTLSGHVGNRNAGPSSPKTSQGKGAPSPSRREGRRLRPKTSASHSTSSLIPERFSRRRARSASSSHGQSSKEETKRKLVPETPHKRFDEMVSSWLVPVSLPFSSVGGLAMPNISTSIPSSVISQTTTKIKISMPGDQSTHGSPVIVSAFSDSGLNTTVVEDVNFRNEHREPPKEDERLSSERESTEKPVLYHPSPKNVSNPHDHSLLERIHREMHESRFINLSPLALLPNLLNLYFSGVVSHPPMSITFPSPLPKNTSFFYDNKKDPVANNSGHAGLKVGSDARVDLNVEDDADRDQRSPLPSYVLVDSLRSPDGHRSKFSGDSTPPAKNDDGDRRKEARPKSKRSQKSSQQKTQGLGEAEEQARLATLDRFEKLHTTHEDFRNFPPHDLFMHLSARVQEIVACAEAMWEWVQDEQERWREKQEQRARDHHTEFIREDHRGDEEMRIIRRMTRHEFDGILSRFEMDMRHTISMDRVLGCYIGWHPALPLGRSAEEKNFDKACHRWEGKSGSQPGSQQSSPVEAKGPSMAHSHSSAASVAALDEGGEQHQASSVRFSRTFRIFCAWKPAT